LPPVSVAPFTFVPGIIWFALKTLVFIILFIWARAAYPR
jgi:NADH-quinone oxidoreductase subunit H